MALLESVKDKIKNLFFELGKGKVLKVQKNLTYKYKNKTGESKPLIEDLSDSGIYAISRMPATNEVLCSLFKTLISQNILDKNLKSIIDVGAGTGAGYFAIKDYFENAELTFVENNKNMIDVFKKLTEYENIIHEDILNFESEEKYNLVLSSYVLSEMTEFDRVNAVCKLFNLSNKYVLLVDAGTPSIYEQYMNIKGICKKFGFKVIAPCKNEMCPLKNDYCQFYARVERSSVHKLAKDAIQSYEDEKYFYLLFEKIENNGENVDYEDLARVIRRPIIKKNLVELKVCASGGVKNVAITKKDKEKFKMARKIKINEQMKVWYEI